MYQAAGALEGGVQEASAGLEWGGGVDGLGSWTQGFGISTLVISN